MKLLISENDLKLLKSRELVPIECERCQQIFYKEQHYALAAINGSDKSRLRFCTSSCAAKNQIKKPSTKIEKTCKNCDKIIFLTPSRILENNFCSRKCNSSYYAQFKKVIKPFKAKRVWAKIINLNCSFCHKDLQRKAFEYNLSKSKTFFCCKSCKTKYANQYQIIHKPKSRAETLLCDLIKLNFPDLEVKENVRDILPSKLEIDIFIPKFKLAIELNGPVHYLPIFGQDKLQKTQNKDFQKQKEINDLGLNLIIVDISRLNSRQSTDLFINEYFIKYIKPILETY